MINNYFELLAAYFPKLQNGCTDPIQYARDLNWGEFIHFWSGAANTNLKSQATKAFGWTAETEIEFKEAQRNFPCLIYNR